MLIENLRAADEDDGRMPGPVEPAETLGDFEPVLARELHVEDN